MKEADGKADTKDRLTDAEFYKQAYRAAMRLVARGADREGALMQQVKQLQAPSRMRDFLEPL